jgi:hypothetical protein
MKHKGILWALMSLYVSPIAMFLWLWISIASAGVTCTLPFNLQNGTTADATQVMANYNALVTCLSNSAAAGSNSDITALLGLTTPIAPNEGGSSVYIGGTTTNVSNLYSFTSTIPINFSLTQGNIVSFVAPSANTGATQLNAAGTGATNLFRQTATGPVAMTGGEIQALMVVIAYYDGTEFQCINCVPSASVPTGATLDFSGVTPPNGFLLANGQAVSRTTFANLFNVLNLTGISGTTNGTSTVTIPAGTGGYQVGWYVGATVDIPCNSFITSIPDGTHIVLNNTAIAGSPTITIGPYQQGDCSTTFNVPNYVGKALAYVDGGVNITSGTISTPVTFSNGSAVISAVNAFAVGQAVTLTTTGSLPTNFAVSTTYYVVAAGLSALQFELSATPGGSAIVAGSVGSGSQAVAVPVCPNAGSIGDKSAAPNIGCGGQADNITQAGLPNTSLTGTSTGTFANAAGSQQVQGGTGANPILNSLNVTTVTSTVPLNGGITQVPTKTLTPTALVYKIIKT